MADTVGQADLRAEAVERAVKGFALQQYKFKQLCMINSSSAWSEVYYQETAADPTNAANSNLKVPRLAKFPHLEPSWTKKTGYNEKFGGEGTISYEDGLTNNVDVIARTLLRIGRSVAKAVDDEIWDTLTESQSPSTINSYSITAGYEWDSATVANRRPIHDLLQARKEIGADNVEIGDRGFVAVSEADFASLLANEQVRNAGQFYTDDVTRNGVVGRIAGLTVIVSNSVTADYALVGVAKECATWKSVVPLTVVTIYEPGQHWIVRAWEIGHTQLVQPLALCLISNTQA